MVVAGLRNIEVAKQTKESKTKPIPCTIAICIKIPDQCHRLLSLTGSMISPRLYVQNAFPWYICSLNRELQLAYLSKFVSLTVFSILGQFLLQFLHSYPKPSKRYHIWAILSLCPDSIWKVIYVALSCSFFCTFILKCFLSNGCGLTEVWYIFLSVIYLPKEVLFK